MSSFPAIVQIAKRDLRAEVGSWKEALCFVPRSTKPTIVVEWQKGQRQKPMPKEGRELRLISSWLLSYMEVDFGTGRVSDKDEGCIWWGYGGSRKDRYSFYCCFRSKRSFILNNTAYRCAFLTRGSTRRVMSRGKLRRSGDFKVQDELNEKRDLFTWDWWTTVTFIRNVCTADTKRTIFEYFDQNSIKIQNHPIHDLFMTGWLFETDLP